MTRVLRGLNTLAVMPTGAGKSLCYQLPASLLKGITVVVSPLIALMQDQCDKLNELGIAAVQINSAVDTRTLRDAEEAIAESRARIVFTTPERLADAEFRAMLKKQQLSLFVVDEAHCISQWGHDFRPAFVEIGTVLPELGSPPVLALTATANEDVMADIAKQLRIPAAGMLTGSSYRPNLQLAVESMQDDRTKLQRLVEVVASSEGPTIVYAATVKAVESVHAALLEAGLAAVHYHGKMSSLHRKANQQLFMSDQKRVMVATSAFGLGIDKADVRLVVHYQMPAALDVYYQEAGRAGRDGAPARCVLMFLAGDRAVQQFFLNGRYPTQSDGEAVIATLSAEQHRNGSAWTLDSLQEKLQRPASKLRVLLNLLRQEGWLQIDGEGGITPCVDFKGRSDLQGLLTRYVSKSEQDQARLEQMTAYAQTGGCRWRAMLDAFEETLPSHAERCLRCDNCHRIEAHERQVAPIVLSSNEVPPQQSASPRSNFTEGDSVRVRRYGLGTVVEATSESVTVAFQAGAQQRCFHPDFVKAARSPSALT